jgi:recombination protein RecA
MDTLKDADGAMGNRTKAKVVKNKLAPPFRQAEFDIVFGEGISQEGCIIDTGVQYDIITKSGSFFSYNGNKIGQGKEKARAYLESEPEVMKAIEEKIKDKYREMDPDEGIPEEDGDEDFDLRAFDGDEE